MNYYLAVKKKKREEEEEGGEGGKKKKEKIIPFGTADSMDGLDSIMLSEIDQSEKGKYHTISLIYGI